MADEITLRQMNAAYPVAPGTRAGSSAQRGITPTDPAAGPSFQDLLQERLSAPGAGRVGGGGGGNSPTPIKFSSHAQTRITSRSISWGDEQSARLEAAVGRAQAKGARESLVLMDNIALIVSIKNRMVITAVDADSLKENVFTNIDSAVIG